MVSLEGGEEVVNIFAVKIFDPEVVDTQTEGNVASLVYPEADRVGDGIIAVCCKIFDEVIVGQDCCLL